MNCKHCQQELERGVTLCPHCGTDNAQSAAEEMQPEITAEVQEEKKTSASRLTLMVVACVVLIAVLAGVVLGGMGILGGKEEPTETQETFAGTIPADGNPDDVTCKGSYTLTDEEVVEAGETVIAQLGDMELTNSDLQVYYWRYIQNFITQYKYDSLDLTQPLDRQACEVAPGQTWQQYFITASLNEWRRYASLAKAGLDIGIELPQEDLDALAGMEASLDAQAGTYGFETGLDMLKSIVGAGGIMRNYIDYMELNWRAYAYHQHAYETMSATDAEIEAYFDANAEKYEKNEQVTKETKLVDVRHILILPEGATVDTVLKETFPEEAWEAGLTQAETILQQWRDGDATEEQFGELAKEHSADTGSGAEGGLITNISLGVMVENFENWCFDPARQVGDAEIVKTEFGYHIIYYVGENFIWDEYAEADLLTEKLANHIEETQNALDMTVYYDRIALGYVDLTA